MRALHWAPFAASMTALVAYVIEDPFKILGCEYCFGSALKLLLQSNPVRHQTDHTEFANLVCHPRLALSI